MLAVPLAIVVLAQGAIAHAAPVTPNLSASLSGSGIVGEPLTDTITVSNGMAPTGTLTLAGFGPADPTCSQPPVSSASASVAGNGEYMLTTVPDDVGTYRYVVSYDGDAANAPVATGCGDADQTVTTTPAHSEIATTASSTVPVGGSISDTARLSHAVAPSGTVTFSLYGPDDAGCAQPPVATSTAAVTTSGSLDARATSAPYAALAAGTYRWVAAYGGDARNLPAMGACGDTGESVTVTASSPSNAPGLRLRAPGGSRVGQPVSVIATLTLPGIATGTITFRVYRPGDEACRRGAVVASTRQVLGNGDYVSDPFTPDEPGTYRVVAAFHGADGTTLTSGCDNPSAAFDVAPGDRLRPVLEKTVTVSQVRGDVLVRLPGADGSNRTARASAIGFVPVHRSRLVPVGSTVDVHAGVARITSATVRAGLQSGVFHGSSFVVQQRASDRGLVELRLRTGANARAACATQGRPQAGTAKRRRLRRRVITELRAKVRGRFRTHGKHSSASAHGTEWLTIERCDGTLTQVISDVVAVRDFQLRRTVLVRAGQSYLAKADG